jgi:hypothetical protein
VTEEEKENTMLTSIIAKGFRSAAGNFRLVFFYYLMNLVCALITIYPFSLTLSDFGGNSLLSRNLTSGPDLTFIAEFLHNDPSSLTMMGGLLLLSAILSMFLLLVLAGGSISYFRNGGEFSSYEFWGDGYRFTGRFLRIFLWSLPILALAIASQFLEKLFVLIFWGSDPYSNIRFYGGFVRIAIGGFGLFLYNQIVDYARIDCVVNDERSARRSVIRGLKFFFRNFFSATLLGMTFTLAGFLVLAVYLKATGGLSDVRGITLVVAVILQQLYMFVRAMLRVGLISGQVEYEEKKQPAATPGPEFAPTM